MSKRKSSILLTGATGFLGAHLLEALLIKGYQVTILKRSTSDLWRIKHLLKNVKYYDIDTLPLEKAFEETKPDVVIHIACSYGRNGELPHQVAETNLVFGLRLLDAASFYKTKIFINTDTLLPRNINAYALSKKQFTEWLYQRSKQIQVINLRLEHMYGPKDDQTKFFPWIIEQFKKNVDRVNLTTGEQLRDFIYVADIVSAYLITLEKHEKLNEYNDIDVGTGVLTSVKDFVICIKSTYDEIHGGNNIKLGFGDLPYREGELMSVSVDNKNLLELGWSPMYQLKDGIKKIIKE